MATLRQPQIPGIEVEERRMTSADARQFARDPGPGNPRVGPGGSAEARAFQGAQNVQGVSAGPQGGAGSAARPVGVGVQGGVPGGASGNPAAQVKSSLRARVAAQPGVSPKATYLAGRGVKKFGPAAAGWAAFEQLGEYQLDDPDVDSSAAGTLNALSNGDLGGVRRSLGKGAIEAGMDLGGMAASTVDFFTGGRAGATEGYNNFLRGQFGDQLRVGGGPKPAPQPTAPATPAAPGAAPGAPRYNFPNTAGDGRGSAADPNRTDVDPSSKAFGAARDMGPELGTVPRVLPGDLRKGVIHKTMDANGRPVYSGIDVGNDAQMVDGMGRQLRGGGTLSVMPGMSRSEIDATLSRPAPGQGQGGPVNLTAQGGLFDTPRARRQAEALRLEGRGQDLNYSATTRGQDMALKGTMAGIQERRDARQQEQAIAQAQRLRQGAYVQQANGDMAKAANAAMAAGDTAIAEALSGAADKADGRAVKRRDAVKDILKPLSITKDDKGNPVVNDAMVESTTAALEGVAGSLGLTSVDELLSDANRARAAVKLIQGLNQRNQTFTDFIGLTEPTQRQRIPSLRGAQSESVGLFDGAVGFGRSAGDRRFVTQGGDLYVPQEIYADEGVQNLLAELMKKK